MLDDILVVPETSKNLLFVHQLCVDNMVSVEFDKHKVKIRDITTKEVIAEGRKEASLYQLPMRITRHPKVLSSERISSNRWHARLGHLHEQAVKQLINKSVISSNYKTMSDCDFCLRNKSSSLPHKVNNRVYAAPLDLIYTNIWGPAPVTSSEVFWYYINFVDAATNFNWVFPLASKAEVGQTFERFRL